MVRHSKLEREWAVSVLSGLVTSGPARFKVGVQLRAQMVNEIEKGLPLSGYRPMWIKRSAHSVVGLLRDISEKFNDEHSTDQASIVDMLDMLSTATNMLQQALANNSRSNPSKQPEAQVLS